MEDQRLAESLYQLAASIHKAFRFYSQNNDNAISLPRISLLQTLYEQPNCNLKTLSQMLFTSPSSLCITLNRLDKEGMVVKQADQTDRRNTLYMLSDKGEAMLFTEKEKLLCYVEGILDDLDAQDRQYLEAISAQMHGLVGSITKKDENY